MSNSLAKIALATFAITAFSGCAKPPLTLYSIPEIGTIATKGIGSELVMQGYGRIEPNLIIEQEEMIGTFILKKGKYPYDDENKTVIKFRGALKEIYLNKANNYICADKISKETCTQVKYSLEPSASIKFKDSFQKTLLYNGIVGNKITLGYREFYNNNARPAFSNQAEYDLSSSSVIGYKGARIEVISATNTEITYKMLSGFSALD